MEITSTPAKKITLVLIVGLIYLGGMVTPAVAQTSYATPAKIKSETRKSKRAAAAYEAEHKETHLNVANFNYKVGEAGRKPVIVDEESTEYNSDKERNALFETRKELNKKKTLLKKQKRRRN